MAIKKTYKVIGNDCCDTTFTISLTFLQVRFSGVAVETRAPLDKITFTTHPALTDAVNVHYSNGYDVSVFWTIAIAKEDARELQSIIDNSKKELNKFRNTRNFSKKKLTETLT